MIREWYNLAWKEWHEHKWKLAAMFGVLWGITTLSILMDPRYDGFGTAIGMLILGSVPMGVFMGLSAAASEQSRRTLPFLQSLPVPMRQVAARKLLFGFFTLVIAIAATAISISLWGTILDYFNLTKYDRTELFFTGVWEFDLTIMCTLTAGSLFLWSAAAGVNRKDEVSAGVFGIGAIAGAWGLIMFVLYCTAPRYGPPPAWLEATLLGAAPGAFAVLLSNDYLWTYLFPAIVVGIAVHTWLIARYVRTFGNVTDAQVRSPQVTSPQTDAWLGPPMRFPATAILWKQFRESGALALAGLVATVAICVLMFAVDRDDGAFGDFYLGVATFVGYIIVLVVGIGVALHDSEPRLNTFWRSRPIDADIWFTVKYLTGLAIVVATIYAPMLMVAGLSGAPIDPDAKLAVPATHIALYAAAVATTCLVRHAIYAAILSIGVISASISAIWLIQKLASRFGWIEPFSDMITPFENPTLIFFGSIFCFGVCSILAWLAMRYDWGVKSRY
jgi:hypothetical protein